jgi:predicted methyltransferase
MINQSPFNCSSEAPRAVDIAQGFIGQVLKSGDIAVDATAGNGNDTLFLARLVGHAGRVYSFDIQEEALAETHRRLQGEALTERVTLLNKGHEFMENFLDPGSCKAVMFNLGYLPGGNKEIKTLPRTTLGAAEQALNCLAPGGRLSMVVYRGHPGAREESGLLDDFISSLDPSLYWTARMVFPNMDNRSPYVIMVQKKGRCK